MFKEIPLINLVDYSFTKRLWRFSVLLYFALYTTIILVWIFMQLNPDKRNCYTEIIATIIIICIYTFLTNLGSIYFLFKGRNKLTKLLTKINKVLQNLQLHFNSNISFHRQRTVTLLSVTAFLVFAITYFIYAYIFDENKPKSGSFMFVIFVIGDTTSALQTIWTWVFTLIQLILFSILVNQIHAMTYLDRKGDYRYAHLCLDVLEQSACVKDVFGIITLALIYTNFCDSILTMWSVVEPYSSCMMGNYQYSFFTGFLWNFAIIESGHRMNKEVRYIFF